MYFHILVYLLKNICQPDVRNFSHYVIAAGSVHSKYGGLKAQLSRNQNNGIVTNSVKLSDSEEIKYKLDYRNRVIFCLCGLQSCKNRWNIIRILSQLR